MSQRHVVAGFLFLLCGAFLDNARGPLLPVLRESFGLSYTQVSLFLSAGYPFAVAATLALTPLFERFGEKRVAIGSALLAALVVAFSHLVGVYSELLALGIALGVVVAIFGTLCNIMVIRGAPPLKRANFLCGLHMMYGIGSFASPVVVTYVLKLGFDWPFTLSVWSMLLIVATLACLVGLPRIAGDGETREAGGRPGWPHIVALLVICAYVGGEVLCSMWMTTYLVDFRGMTQDEAALRLGVFFLVVFIVRAYGAFAVKPAMEWPVLVFALGAGIFGQVAGHFGWSYGFSLAGAMTIFFPVYMARISSRFPKVWRRMTVWVLAAMQLTLLLLHFGMGALSDRIPMGIAYWLPTAMLVAAAFGLMIERALAQRPA